MREIKFWPWRSIPKRDTKKAIVLKYAQLGHYTLLFAKDDYEMYKDLKRTCIAIVLFYTFCLATFSLALPPEVFLRSFRCRSCSPLTPGQPKGSEVFPYLRPPRVGNYLWYPGHGLLVTLPNNDRLKTVRVQCSVTNFLLS